MSDANFVHLHVHTEFSLLDGLSQIKKLVKRAKELAMPAVAITDHGSMFGVIDFYRACKEAEIKPIIGVETYLAPRKMTDRDSVLDKKPFHLLLLAKNQQGYRNLLKIASKSQLEGYYYRPRIDRDTLSQYSEGIIATSGCLAARIPQLVARGQDDEAKEWIGWFQDVFGAENFYLELQQHDIPEIRTLNKWLVDYRQSGHSSVGLVATNDVHYVLKDDYEAHDVLLCIQTGASVKMPKRKDHDNEDARNTRMAMSDNSYYLNSADEMWQLWGEQFGVPEAVHNSLKIAEMCDVNLDSKGYHLPVFPVPEGYDAESYLRYLCEKGLEWRYGDRAHSDPIVRDRLDYELGIIHNMGFDTYFLIVWDLTQFAAHADIWWNVRGSGAGSVAAYCLGITLVDPIQNSLLFERFLNPGRVSMPDIDIDFPDDRRGEMIAYSALKYGEDKVASIITFGTMGAKAAIKDVARAMEVELSRVNKAVSLIPTEAKQKKIEDYVEGNPELKALVEGDPELKAVINMAKQLQGVNRHSSVHAAGVIIADKPLDEYLPLHRVTGKDPSDGALKAVTQFPMETCESLGLLKVDFLGLSTLTIMRKACEQIERFHGIRYDLNNIPYRHDDPRLTDDQRRMLDVAFELMGRGDTVGVFQLESSGMQSMLRDMRPKQFENIVAGVALYRPGPMDFIPLYNRRLHGLEATTYRHEALSSILSETYGIMVYQEQLIQIANKLFGYEAGEADLMRRAVSKKKEKDLAKHRGIFVERGPQLGIDAEIANQIFDDIDFFANYGFNKCLTGDTEIIDAQTGRRVTLDALVSGEVPVEETLTCDLDTLRLKPGKITAVMANGVKPVYRLTTQLGRQITATANHPFYTFDGWRMLGELQAGDKLAVPVTIMAGDLPTPDGSDLGWDAIASIEYVGEQPTYDLTIEGTHNFIANDILVHNSHATDYAMVTVQTAYLKAHYPEEYMMAMLSTHRDDSTKIAHFLDECRRMDIPILPPDVNYSALDFDIQLQADGRRGIRFGLAGIKNAGEAAMAHVVRARESGGAFEGIEDFCRRIDLRAVGKRALESLMKVGAMEAFGNRAQLLAAIDRLIGFSTRHHKDKEIGRVSLFGDDTAGSSEDLFGNLPNITEPSAREVLGWEKELLGLYVTGRPTDKFRDALARLKTETIADLKTEEGKFKHDKTVMVAGEIIGLRKTYTGKGDAMAILQIEDWHETVDSIEVVLFPRNWAKVEAQIESGDLPPLQVGEVVKVTGKLDSARDRIQVIGESVTQNFTLMEAVNADDAYREAVTIGDWRDPEPAYTGGQSSGQPTRGNGNGNGYAPAPTVAPPYTPPAADAYEGRTAPADWSPLPETAGEYPPYVDDDDEASTPAKPPRCIVVTMARTENTERDQRLLKRIYNTLHNYPGMDRFVVLLQVDGSEYELDFKDARTDSWSEDLWLELNAIRGIETSVFDE